MKQPQIDPKKLSSKEGALLALLDTHHSVFVHVDTRKPGVLVPKVLLGQPSIAFEFGYNLPVPVRDLRLEPSGISATLSFQRVPAPCFFPWHAVFLIIGDSGVGNFWEPDVPEGVVIRRGVAEPPKKAEDIDKASKAKTLPPWCKGVIDGGKT